MKLKKLPMLTLAAAAGAALAMAPSAKACEICETAPNSQWTCWSGWSSGSGYCYGGGDTECTFGGSCNDPTDNDQVNYCTYECAIWGVCGLCPAE